MSRGCALAVAGYSVAIATFWAAVADGSLAPRAIASAVFGGVGIFMIVNASRNGLATAARARLVGAAMRVRPRDPDAGAAVIGRIEPLAAPLESPFAGVPCVAYLCEVTSHGKPARLGLGYTAARIQSASGSVALGSAPVPRRFFSEARPEVDATDRALAWEATGEFRSEAAGAAMAVLAKAAFGGAPVGSEPVRVDVQLADPSAADAASRGAREVTLPVGATVCAVGTLSADGTVLEARARWPVGPLELYGEPAAEVRRALAAKAPRLAVIGSALGAVLVAIGVALS